MYVPEKLKLNKFELVRIPHAREMFARFGFKAAPANMYGGDEPINTQNSNIGKVTEAESILLKEALNHENEQRNEPEND